MGKQLVYDVTVTDTDRDVAGAVLRAGTTELSATGTSLDVRNTTAEGILTTIDTDTGALVTEQLAQGVTLDAIETDTGNIATDTAALVVDLAAIEVEQLAQGVTLDSIETDTGNIATDTAALVVDLAAIEVDIAAIEAEQLAQGVTLDSIETDTGSIDSTLTALSKAAQDPHGATDRGIAAMARRSDTLADLAGTDGDYTPLQVNADGALYVDIGAATDPGLSNTDFSTDSKSITSTSASILNAAPLAGRKRLYIANEGTKKMYIGKTTATTSGFPISPGDTLELNAGPALVFVAVTAASTADCRTLQMS